MMVKQICLNMNLGWARIRHPNLCNIVFASSLKKFASCLHLDVKVMLVKSLVFDHIKDMTFELSGKLRCSQNYSFCFIFHLRCNDQVLDLSTQLSLMKINDLRKCHTSYYRPES